MTPLAILVTAMPQDVKKEASDNGSTVALQFQRTERLKGGTMWGFYINTGPWRAPRIGQSKGRVEKGVLFGIKIDSLGDRTLMNSDPWLRCEDEGMAKVQKRCHKCEYFMGIGSPAQQCPFQGVFISAFHGGIYAYFLIGKDTSLVL